MDVLGPNGDDDVGVVFAERGRPALNRAKVHRPPVFIAFIYNFLTEEFLELFPLGAVLAWLRQGSPLGSFASRWDTRTYPDDKLALI